MKNNQDRNDKPIALLDLDGTLCDYHGALERDMALLRSPDEPFSWIRDQEPSYIRRRMDLIRNDPSWWKKLEPLKVGMEIYHKLMIEGFRIVVLTQGPKRNAEAWKGKVLWCLEHLAEDTDIIITRDKGLVYGKILVDDFPPYAEAWLKHRPRGLVIMPTQPWNANYISERVIKYGGSETDIYCLNKNIQIIKMQFEKEKVNRF